MKSGVAFAVLAALLFGVSTPFAKLLLGEQPPILLAGLLYLGSGVGLSFLRLIVRTRAGVPQSVAMSISGHRTVSTFLRYDIASDEDKRDALRAVAAAALKRSEPKIVALRHGEAIQNGV